MSNQELYRCRGCYTAGDVISYDKNGQPKVSAVWPDMTKGKLRVTDESLVFKNVFTRAIEIPYAEMNGALLLSTKMAFVRYNVLWVVDSKGSHGISFLRNKFWDGKLPFQVVREDANTSLTDLVKEFAKKASTGVVGNVAEGVVDAGSAAAAVGAKLVGTGVSEAAGAALDEATEKLNKKLSKDRVKARFVVRRGSRKSKALTEDELVALVRKGKLEPGDRVADIASGGKVVSAQSMIEKYS